MNKQLFLLLLLMTAVALADDKTRAKRAAGAAEAQKKTEAAQATTEHAQVTTEQAQAATEQAQAATEHAQAATEGAQGQNGEGQAQTGEDPKLISVPGGKALGMSILGNQDAPKSLVIVPWKSSELGDSPGISPMLDDSRQPVDKEVFMRALRYYEIRSGIKP
jgi:hypothetical protein